MGVPVSTKVHGHMKVPMGSVDTGIFLGTGVPMGHRDTLGTWGHLWVQGHLRVWISPWDR